MKALLGYLTNSNPNPLRGCEDEMNIVKSRDKVTKSVKYLGETIHSKKLPCCRKYGWLMDFVYYTRDPDTEPIKAAHFFFKKPIYMACSRSGSAFALTEKEAVAMIRAMIRKNRKATKEPSNGTK
jgi:hypothetical protein